MQIAVDMSATAGGAPRYIPLMAIGRGGMGRIDLAVAVGLPGAEQLVVLKRLRDDADSGPDAGKELVREAHLSARLMHPNVAATLGLDVLGDELVVVLEYLEGATLSTLMRCAGERGEWIPTPILLRILRDVLAGLGYAHDLRDYDESPLGIVHRDVSPSNVFVTTEGITKVLDFGIAKTTSCSTTVTPLGYVKGKLGYMPPEQIVGLGVDLRADLYAVGVMLWEGLARRRFASTTDVESCISQRLEHDAPSVRAFATEVPASLDHLVRTCLARDPRARWPTAALLRAALDAHVALYGGDASPNDVARFVERHCGEALRARRTYVQDRFAHLIAPTVSTARMKAAPDRHSTSPVAVDLARLPRLEARDFAATVRTPPLRAPVRWFLPAVALVVGAGLSLAAGEVKARLQTMNTTCVRPSAPRAAEVVSATAAPGVRTKADHGGPSTVEVGRASSRAKGAPRAVATLPDDEPAQAVVPAQDDATIGFATIDSYPWSRVTIDGSAAGVTPIVHAPLKPGAHTVILENPERGRHEMTITVREGATTAERWQW